MKIMTGRITQLFKTSFKPFMDLLADMGRRASVCMNTGLTCHFKWVLKPQEPNILLE